MRKQAKILLFALLVVLMVATMVVVASAAKTTEGASDANYLVEAEAGNEYYSTIAEAVEAVKDGGKVTLLKDVAEEAPSLGAEKTYTIDGAGFTMTLTPAAREYRPETEDTKPQAGVAFHIWLGHVTLKNVTLELAADTKATVMFFIQNQHRNPEKLSFTLENVVAEFTSQYGIWLHQEATVTIKGENTKIKGGSTDTIRLQGGSYKSIVSVEGGTFTSTGSQLFNMLGNGGTLNVSGGTFTAKKMAVLNQVNTTLNISGGTFTCTAAAGANVYMFHLPISNTSVHISGADTVITGNAGVKAVFAADNGGSSGKNMNKKISVTDATIDGGLCWLFSNSQLTVDIAGTATFKDSNNTLKPTVIGGNYIGAFNVNSAADRLTTINIKGGTFEWGKSSTLTYHSFFYGNYLVLNVGNFSEEANAPAAEIKFNTIATIYAIRLNNHSTATFKNANVSGTKYYMLALYGNCTATVESGTYVSDDKIFTTYNSAQLTINGGTMTAAGNVIFSVNGTLNINGGELTGGASSQVAALSGGTLNVTGGTLKAGNNVIRTGTEQSATTITINISGGSLTNTGGGNQLIRANSNDTRIVYINILPGANLVQNQNQYVVRIQTGIGVINMTGGTVVSNGTYAPFGITKGADSEFKMSGGTVVVTQGRVVALADGKTAEITGGIVVMKNKGEESETKLISVSGGTAVPVVKDAIVLFNVSEMVSSFEIAPGTSVFIDTFMPKIKFAGDLYNLYMTTSSNAAEDIVTEDTFGASFYLGEDESKTGLRFTSYLSDSIIALAKAALDAGKTVSYGTLIAPVDYVAAAGAFTKEALEKVNAPAGKMKYADVPANVSKRDADGDGVAEAFSATLVGIQEVNYDRVFASVAYVVIDGETFYSAYNSADNARCLRAIVVEYTQSDEFLEIMDSLSEEALELLTKYLGEYA